MAPTQQAWLQQAYPWTRAPLITNAPMGGAVSPQMVAEVTRAGGLGFLGAGYEAKGAAARLAETRRLLGTAPDAVVPVGMGVLCFAIDLDAFVALVVEHRPAAVWLFAPVVESDYALWASRLRAASPAHIWIQTNGVASALRLARSAAPPDVLVMQGADAGGHGPGPGAGIVSLVPETADALAAAGFGYIPVVAAGGIADARGAAAALALGAAGVTLGTRFLATPEATLADGAYATALLRAADGGQATAKTPVFDEVQNAGGNIWPAGWDGRALRNAMVVDDAAGVPLAEARKRHQADKAFRDDMETSRAVAWAGTGVGLVRDVVGSARVVTDTRDGAVRILQGFTGLKL